MTRKNYTILLILFFTLFVGQIQAQALINEGTRQIELDVHTLVNQYRANKGLKELRLSTKLSEIAMKHSKDMANGRVAFSHQGFKGRASSVRKIAGFSCTVAENLYATTYANIRQISSDAVKGWISSSGHRKNMVGNYIFTGIAVARSRDGEYFITQLFIGK